MDEKIERTDALIDDIVYELYGLTDEETETVEAAVGGRIGIARDQTKSSIRERPQGASGSPARTK